MSPHPFGGFDDEIAIAADLVLRAWWRMLADEDPWSHMPADDAYGMMRPILTEVLNEARECNHRERGARLMVAASMHGAFRHAQRHAPKHLDREFTTIIDAAEKVLVGQGMGPNTIEDTLTVLEGDIRMAHEAALEAWMRCLSRP